MSRFNQLLDGPVGAAMAWLTVFATTFVLGLAGQWLIFSNRNFPGWSVMTRWPVLWIAYFLIGHSVGEHSARWLVRQLGRWLAK